MELNKNTDLDLLILQCLLKKQRLENNSINCEIVDISEIKNINEKVIALYPAVGENLDYLNLHIR